jgi:uncharacterized protein (TIGR02145 family)
MASGNIIIGVIQAPSAVTNAATSLSAVGATLNGSVNGNGSSTDVTFEYGLTTSYGNPVTATPSPVTGSSFVSAPISGLLPHTVYHYRVKVNNCAGSRNGEDRTFTTLCVNLLTVIHYSGTIAPVSKTVTYEIVESTISGTDQCWIARNLGASSQAASATDNTEAAAGWYWQFNHRQGYRYSGTTRTPNTAWNTSIDENSDWLAANDPCVLLGSGWRIPTSNEWSNADRNGAWSNYNNTFSSVLKIHAAGRLNAGTGVLELRGSGGFYWSSNQYASYGAYHLIFESSANSCGIAGNLKEWGGSIRCLKE